MRLRVVNGSRALGIPAHSNLYNVEVTPLGPDYGHQVKVSFVHNGTQRTLYARHMNRVNEPEFNMNSGNPLKKIRVRNV